MLRSKHLIAHFHLTIATYGLVAAMICSLPCLGQTSATSAHKFGAERSENESYELGPGDLLAITFPSSPELNTKVHISETGEIKIPLLSKAVYATGLTTIELSNQIATALQKSKQLTDPSVIVTVEEHHSHYVTVFGAVDKPGVYPLTRPTRLIEILSIAGGLKPNPGATVTLVHGGSAALPSSKLTSEIDASVRIDLAKLIEGKDPSLNSLVYSGDTVNVSLAPIIVVYVVGAVTKPGGYTIQDPNSGLTVLQALALGEGLTSVASPKHGLVIRRPDRANRRELVPIDLTKLLDGRMDDQELQANDILFIPESRAKKNAQVMARAAEQAVIGIATYGVGLRLGTKAF